MNRNLPSVPLLTYKAMEFFSNFGHICQLIHKQVSNLHLLIVKPVVQHQSTLANWLFSEQKRYRQFTRPFPMGWHHL